MYVIYKLYNMMSEEEEEYNALIEAEYSEWLSSRENFEENYNSLSIENPFLIDEY